MKSPIDESLTKAFGQRLSGLLKKKKWKPGTLAAKMKKSSAMTSGWAAGRSIPTLPSDWHVLCYLLETTTDYLIFGTVGEKKAVRIQEKIVEIDDKKCYVQTIDPTLVVVPKDFVERRISMERYLNISEDIIPKPDSDESE